MAYSQEQWDRAKALFEQGLSLYEIHLETEIDRSTISRKAKKDNWTKSKTQQLKSDIIEIEKQKSTLDAKINSTVENLATLSDFEITILDQQIQSETGIKSLIFSTANLALIRNNQLLTKNKKTVLTKEVIYNNEGKPLKAIMTPIEMELNPTDIKEIIEGTDKASITLGVNQRHSNTVINNANAQQTVEAPTIVFQRIENSTNS